MKYLFYAIILAGLGYGLYYAYEQVNVETEPDVDPAALTDVAERRTLREVVRVNGEVRPVVSTDVRSEINGRIVKIHVLDGQLVERGDVLVELDRVSLESELTEARRNLEKARLQMAKSKRDFERLERLSEKEFATDIEVADARTEFELSRIDVEVAQTRVERATDNLAETTITAPQSGIAANIQVNEGQVIQGASSVNSGTTLMTIHDLSRLFVETDINEIDIARLDEGMKAEVTFDAISGERFPALIERIYTVATNQNNQRTFQTRIAFEADGKTIRPGISANVDIPIAEAEDVVTITLSGIFTEGGTRYVYVMEDPLDPDPEKRTIQTGVSDARFIEIKEGLTEGETVSLVRPARLRTASANGQRG
ncbi:MAG: efflux RND transporter periplasmic adaptor subunit [Opitutales bacterium]